MGKLVVDAIFFRDFPVVQTVLILSATIFVAINLLVDAALHRGRPAHPLSLTPR